MLVLDEFLRDLTYQGAGGFGRALAFICVTVAGQLRRLSVSRHRSRGWARMLCGRLAAWIERQEQGFLAAFVGEFAMKQRMPATMLFASRHEAQSWINDQAEAIGVQVKWVE